jgi:hypothetical protein
MSFSDLKFAQTDFNGQDVASLPDQVIGQAEMLKARFDNIGKNMIALGKFNELCDKLDDSITETLGKARDKVPSEFAVTNAMVNAGMGDMLKSVYDPQNKAEDIFAYAAPRVHTHTENQVVGLEESLQGLQTQITDRAPAQHTHAPTDLTEPVPILKGGTGAGSRKDALQNLSYIGGNPITSAENDTRAAWTALGTGYCSFNIEGALNDQPSRWGIVVNISYGTVILQIFKASGGGGIYYRDGDANGWNNTWTRIYTDGRGIVYSDTQPAAAKGKIWLKPIA